MENLEERCSQVPWFNNGSELPLFCQLIFPFPCIFIWPNMQLLSKMANLQEELRQYIKKEAGSLWTGIRCHKGWMNYGGLFFKCLTAWWKHLRFLSTHTYSLTHDHSHSSLHATTATHFHLITNEFLSSIMVGGRHSFVIPRRDLLLSPNWLLDVPLIHLSVTPMRLLLWRSCICAEMKHSSAIIASGERLNTHSSFTSIFWTSALGF